MSNPRGAELGARAQRAYREFHWGIPSKRLTRKRASPPPRALTELGKLYSVTYQTRKRGERARLFEHEFERPLPSLAMDVENQRLHVVGGGYTVTADGITR